MRTKVRVNLFNHMSKSGKRITSVLVIMAFVLSNLFPLGMIPFIFPMENAYAADQIGLAVKYDDFSDIRGIQLVKKAAVNGSVLTVSPNDGGPALGAAYTSNKIKLKDENSFSTYFVFNFDDRYSVGAEGMAFVLQTTANNVEGITTNKFGTGGIEPSIAVEFDTFQNTGQTGGSTVEPSGHHVAVFKNGDPYGGNIKTAAAPAGLNFTDATKYHVWIDYDGLTDNLTIKMGTTDVFNDASQVLATSVDIDSILGTDEVFAGFSAGSGDYRQDHNVYKWYMRNDYAPIDLSGAVSYYETTSLNSNLSVINGTESEISYTLKNHLDEPINGETVSFATTDGVLSTPQGVTDANGQVTVCLQSDSKINATVTAAIDSGRFKQTIVAIAGQMTDQESVDADSAAIEIADLLGDNLDDANITTNLSLPTAGANGTTISWSSTNTDYISNSGAVSRPAYEAGEQNVSLTATVSKGSAAPKTTGAFTFVVKATAMSDQESVDTDVAAIKIADLLGGNTAASNIISNLSLPTSGANETTISWSSTNTSYISNSGAVSRPTYKDGDRTVNLTATVSKGSAVPKTSEAFTFVVKATAISDQESADIDADALDYFSFIGKNVSPFSLESNLELPSKGKNSTSITWESSDNGYITNSGIVSRPDYDEGFAALQLTATVAKGAASVSKHFQLAVKPLDDTIAPSVVSAAPSEGATIANDNTISITFSENICIADKSKIKITVIDENGTQINAGIIKSINDNTLEIEPVYEKTDLDKIILLIENDAITDLADNPLENNFQLNFTSKTTRPELILANVENNAKSVPINQSFILDFADEIFVDEEQISLEYLKCGSQSEKADIVVDKGANKLTIRALSDLLPNEKYRLYIPNEAIADSAGHVMKAPLEINFASKAISEINLLTPLLATDTYIFGDYIRLEFDQLFDAEISDDTWKNNNCFWWERDRYQEEQEGNYFTFGKSLFIKKDKLSTFYHDGFEDCYRVEGMKVASRYNSNCAVSFGSNEAMIVETEKIHCGRGHSYYKNYLYFTVADVSVGSSPLTPVDFGQEIETGYVTLDYQQSISAQDLSLIYIDNSYGADPEITAEIDGSKLIVRPAAGQWIESQEYILKVPQGAVKTAAGETIKRFEYPFKTPVKYDYAGTTINIQFSKLAVGGDNYIYGNIRNNRPYRYYWGQNKDYTSKLTVSNVTTGEIKQLNSYDDHSGFVLGDKPGIYEAVLQVADNGYTHEFRDTFEVVDIDNSFTKLTADKSGVQTVIDYTAFEDDYKTWARLTNKNMELQNRNVKLQLFGAKTGNEYYSAVEETNTGGYASFNLPVDSFPYGKLKAVFSSPETDEKATYYLSPKRLSGRADLNIFIYDNKTKKLIRNAENFSFTIDGDAFPATRQSNGSYLLEDVRPGTHDLKVGARYYCYNGSSKKLKNGKNKIVYYLNPYIPGSDIRMNTVSSEYAGNSYKDAIFIDGVDANITFNAKPYWNGHQPGQIIYEFYKGNKTKKFESQDGKLTVNVGKLLGPGTRGRVYAVSQYGKKSNKQDLKIEVASKPSYCHASFSAAKKRYFLNYNFNLETLGGARVPKDWPLIGGQEFSIDVGKFQLGGVMDPYGKIDFAIGLSKLDFENARVMSNYKDLVKDFTAGNFGDKDSEIGFSFDTNQQWQYDASKDKWSYKHAEYTLYLEGEASYTQYFTIVVVPAYLKGVLGVEADAKLNVDVLVNKKTSSEGFKYSGQIDAAPSIEVVVGAGVDGLNVEGFLNGKIATSLTIPKCDFAANGEITGGVRATALLWSWEKNAIEYSWTMAAPKRALLASNTVLPRSFSLAPSNISLSSEQIKQSDFKILKRDEDDSNVWIGSQPMLRALRAPEKINNSILLKDVPDFTNADLTAFAEDLLLVWAEDNPDRTASNRTELKYAIYDGAAWTEGSFFNLDDTADFNPVVASASGTAVIVWQDMNRLITEDEEIDKYLSAAEISAAEYSNGELSDKSTLTDDAYYDCMPAIAYSDGKTHLAWVKNKSNNILSPEAGSFEILYSVNDGSEWSDPITLETGLNQIADLDIAADGSELTIVYNLDEDGNILTSEDWEVYAKQAADGTWLPAARLTDDQMQDSNIRVIYENNEATAIWLRDGILSEMSIQDQSISSIYDISAQAFEIAQSDNDIEAISYITGIENSLQEIKTIFYDSNAERWSKPVKITGNDCVNSEIAAAITANNEMTVINKAKEKIIEQIDGKQYANVGAANIEAHKIMLTKDLKVVENTLSFGDEFISDANNEILVGVENCGEFTINGFDVVFYDGNMEQIALTSVQTPLLPGEKTIVATDWLAPETVNSPEITVTIDPEDKIGDSKISNNTLTEAVLKCDVSIESYRINPIDSNNYLLEMSLANYSSLPAENVEINFYHNDTLINTQNLAGIDCGLTEDVVMELDTGILFAASNIVQGLIDIDVKGTFGDSDESDDNLTIDFNKANIRVNSSNIEDGDSRVPTDTEIELEFSDNVNGGIDYNNIKLTDFSGTPLSISTEIADSRLLIKPLNSLSKGSCYLLTVPEQSLITDYDQTLASDYSLEFITDSSKISVIGSYPVNNTSKIDTTDNISVLFSKNIVEGPEFEQIALVQNGEEVNVGADLSVVDDKIIINPRNALENNTVYNVFIPDLAVMAANEDEFFESSYVFSFATGTVAEGEDTGGSSGGSSGGSKHSQAVKVDPEIPTAYSIGLETAEDSQTAFLVQLSSENTLLNITEELIKEMQKQQKALMLKREDITLMMPEISGESPLNIKIQNQGVAEDLTHENDRVLSDQYMISVQRENTDFLNSQMWVTIPVDLEQINNPEKCAVFYKKDDGEWQPAGGVIDLVSQTMQFRLNGNRPFVVVERDIKFEDTENRWSAEAIEVLTAKGIISGKSASQFDPLGDITRAEFTTLIVRSLFEGTAEYQNTFSDIAPDQWYTSYILKAVELGLVSGVGNGQFAPDERITREQMIVILDRLNQLKAENVNDNKASNTQEIRFADLASASDYSKEAIIRMADKSIVNGYNGNINPKDLASREEAAMMIYKLLKNMGRIVK